LDRVIAKRIAKYLNDTQSSCSEPRQRGKGLAENLSGLWRYRVGDYRVICNIHDDRTPPLGASTPTPSPQPQAPLVVLVLAIEHRKKIYK
jgi:mRNA interferase RelE/StbE